MLPREYTLSQYDSSPPLTACKILVIVIDSFFVEQVENREYTCLSSIWAQLKSHLPWFCAVVVLEVTWPEVTWPEVLSVRSQSRDRKWRQSCDMSRRMFCACATVSCAISALVGPFDRKWQSHVIGRALSGSGPDRKYVLRMPVFPPCFFLSSSTVVTWLPNVTKSHLTPSGFPWVCACGTGCYATSVVTEGTWPLR
jgi:hypothetical protein